MQSPQSARGPASDVKQSAKVYQSPLSARAPRNDGQDVFTAAAQKVLQPAYMGNKPKGEDLFDWLDSGREQKATGLAIGQSLVNVEDVSGRTKNRKKKNAECGPLMLRGAQREGKDHGAKGIVDTRFMSPEDRELHSICEMIGQKAAMKYRTVREALRFVDADRDGFVTRSEVEYFFRAYDVSSETVAGHLVNRLDPSGIGEIEYSDFVSFIGPFIRGEPPAALAADISDQVSSREETPTQEVGPSSGIQPARYVGGQISSPSKKSAGPLPPQADWSVEHWMIFLGRKSSERFGHVMDLIRHVDRDYDGNISRDEMRHFFSIFGLEAKVADKCWSSMLKPGEPEVEYMDFMRAIAPHLDLPGVRGVLHQGGGQGGKRIPVKQRMGSRPPLTSSRDEDNEITEEQRVILAQRQERRNLRAMMQDIGVKLQLKFRHAREAFRGLDLDKDGRIAPTELRAFFRGFGYSSEAADGLFALLDEEGTGEIDFAHFMSHFEHAVVMPAGRIAPTAKKDPLQDKKIGKEVAEIARIVGEHLFVRCRKVSEAFRTLDSDQDGYIDRDELRSFFRSVNMDPDKADKLFQALDMELTGLVPYDAFLTLLGPSIEASSDGARRKQNTEAQNPAMWRLS